MKKVLSIFAIVLCLVSLTAIFYLKNTLIKKNGNLSFKDIQNSAKVYFDPYGIPHIESTNLDDAYFALGYTMAAERLFQMDLIRRAVSGRLSEIFGKDTLEVDILFRKLTLYKNAKEQSLKFDTLDPKAQRMIKSYLKGIDSFLETEEMPLEFVLLGYRPEKFSYVDMIAVTNYMALSFAEGIAGDTFHSYAEENLPEDKALLLRNGVNIDHDFFSGQKIVETPFIKDFHKALDKISDYIPLFHGSNSWVLSGERTVSGKPILANDPHIALSTPHVFYEAHIKTPELEVYGNFLPLIPFPVMGHTPYSAWAITMSEVDDLNIYEEKINPEDEELVMFKNEWVKLSKWTEKIKIKGMESMTVNIGTTPHGPIISGTEYDRSDKVLAIQWSALLSENNVMKTFFELPLANSVDHFKSALIHSTAPGLNISWAHKSGDIAWWMMGKYPKLPEGVSSDIVLKGWDGTQDIERYYEFEENPHAVNPESGVIVTANYKPQDEKYKSLDGYWQPGGRYFRLVKLLEKQKKWDIQGLKSIQTDTVIPGYKKYKKQLIGRLQRDLLTPFELKVLKHFIQWDGDTNKESTGATIFHAWNFFNTEMAFLDELGPEKFKQFGRTSDFWLSYMKLLTQSNHSMWDNIKSDRVENANDIMTAAFKKSVQVLKMKLGSRISKWQWGELHTLNFHHALGKFPPISYLYNKGPIGISGASYVINNLATSRTKFDFNVIHAPATRRLIDFNNIRESFAIVPSGNSGHPLSPHYIDQSLLYSQGKYRLQMMNWFDIKQYKSLNFIPKK